MTVEICPGCGDRFHCFEGDEHICTKCLPPDIFSAGQPPPIGPPVAEVEAVVNPLDKGVGGMIYYGCSPAD